MMLLEDLRTKVEAAHGPAEASDAVRALGYIDTPTNQQIIDSAKAAYAAYQPAVDAMTLALVNSVNDASLADALARLDGTNWASPGVSSSVTEPFFASQDMATAIGVVRRTNLTAVSVGAFTKSLPGGHPGVIGFARDLLGVSTAGLVLELDIFGSIVTVDNMQNLQYGVWAEAPTDLHDAVVGFYANATVHQVSVNLKILLTKALKPYGFVSSTGATVPVASGLFAGTTAQWKP
jgi:hypothetical protein